MAPKMGPNIVFFPHQKSQEEEQEVARVHSFCVSSSLIPSSDIEHERQRERERGCAGSVEQHISVILCLPLSISVTDPSYFVPAMNEKASVSKELNAKHKKVSF